MHLIYEYNADILTSMYIFILNQICYYVCSEQIITLLTKKFLKDTLCLILK